ncbi:hypothetical protein GOODEAATRI_000189 [Goodea atripinnis]|uniref:CLASP N-terminal domain-containing protein n=1 Tax=Goodea atripinnis TaxID=208336 RepID=A0ABV0NQZ0_9TELE
MIFSKFDEVQRSGNMVLSPLSAKPEVLTVLVESNTGTSKVQIDKNFEDDESVDGGRSSSKGASLSGRKAVSMGSFRRPSSASSSKSAGRNQNQLSSAPHFHMFLVFYEAFGPAGRDGSSAGAVDEEDFIQAFQDVPTVQIYSNREVEEAMTKIRDVLSDDKKDWELRVAAVSRPHVFSDCEASACSSNLCLVPHQLKKLRSLLLAGAAEFDCFPQQLRLMEASFKLSAKDLRSQVVREACITLG